MLDIPPVLDLPHGNLVVPAIGLDPATMISYGNADAPPATAPRSGSARRTTSHVAANDAIEFTSAVTRSVDVAAELVARLIADHCSVRHRSYLPLSAIRVPPIC
jgi:hypothetical protein